MPRYQSILAGILALVTVFIVSCGGPKASAPQTYSAEQIEQLQSYASRITTMRDRMTGELEDLIEKENWNYVDMFIHGPLGTLRQQTSLISRNLLPNDRPVAEKLAKDLFVDLEELDAAADANDYRTAVSKYSRSLADMDAFLDLIPES